MTLPASTSYRKPASNWNGFEAYKIYCALKAHFLSSFDYVKYKGRIKQTLEHYQNRKDRQFFERLAKKYRRQDYAEMLIANFVHNPNMWVGDAIDLHATEVYNKWKGIIESLTYRFERDIEHLHNNGGVIESLASKHHQFPPIVIKAFQGDITIETCVIIDQLTGFLDRANTKLSDEQWWIFRYKLLKKYQAIMSFDISHFQPTIRSILTK